MFPRPLALLLACAALTGLVCGDPPVAPSVLDPRTPAEAWNVIRLATANVDRLIAEKRLREVPTQISYCSPALRALGRTPELAEEAETVRNAAGWGAAIAAASLENNEPRVLEQRLQWRTLLDELARKFDPATTRAEIYMCRTHLDFLATDAAATCPRCGQVVIPRRIPYSFLHVTQTKPTIRVKGSANAPLAAGQPATVTFQLAHLDGSPVKLSDLLVTHTLPIHVLIQEAGLGDFQRVQPTPTATPGEYSFTFTPVKPGPHRVWTDVVPVSTALQELPHFDLASNEPTATLADRTPLLTATVPRAAQRGTFGTGETSAGALRFDLVLSTPPLRAAQPAGLQLKVSEEGGAPFSQLEPTLNAFAHLVGFYDDYETVVHLHPGTAEVLLPEARGGPTLLFTGYFPRAGFVRLYAEVQVEGARVVAAFGLPVEP